jgi:hypothetical protein
MIALQRGACPVLPIRNENGERKPDRMLADRPIRKAWKRTGHDGVRRALSRSCSSRCLFSIFQQTCQIFRKRSQCRFNRFRLPTIVLEGSRGDDFDGARLCLGARHHRVVYTSTLRWKRWRCMRSSSTIWVPWLSTLAGILVFYRPSRSRNKKREQG